MIEIIIDNFAGGGGASTGIAQAQAPNDVYAKWLLTGDQKR